jgi:hypothetical protein
MPRERSDAKAQVFVEHSILGKEPDMNTAKHRFLKVAVLFAAVAAVSSHVIGANATSAHNHAGHSAIQQKPTTGKAGTVDLNTIHAKQLPAIQDAIQKAIRHTEAGHPQAALAELKRAQSSLKAAHQALGQHLQPKFVNNRCPIMGSPINAGKVTADLVRNHQGQKVAFCCAGCPAAWDRLGDADKEAKLKKASIPTEPGHGQQLH